MRCPTCGAETTRVVDSRPAEGGEAIRRRRECQTCSARFTTFERTELADLQVAKRSGSTLPFSRSKVYDGMAKAAKGRVEPDQLQEAAAAVERELRLSGQNPVTSEQVGLTVLAQLRELDPVAYVRFASVYKDFQGPEDFEKELHSLRKEEPPKQRGR